MLAVRRTQYSLSAPSLSVVRGLAALGDRGSLVRVAEAFGTAEDEAPLVRVVAEAALAGLDGRNDTAAAEFLVVEQSLRGLGRHYDAACVALDRAASLERLGDERGAGEARDRANALLEPLGCRYPY